MHIDDSTITKLIAAAREARDNAYSPYSDFKVGAAALAESGEVYTGCNVENASYGLTICAERVAILKAVSAGERTIKVIAIVAGEDKIARPCGACLQVMQEFAPKNEPMIIIASAVDGSYDIFNLGEYLPKPFDLNEK